MENIKVLTAGTKIMVYGEGATIQDNDIENSSDDLSNLNYYIKFDKAPVTSDGDWYDTMIHHSEIQSVQCSYCESLVKPSNVDVVTNNDYSNERVICLSCVEKYEGECLCGNFISFRETAKEDAYNTCSICLDNYCDDCTAWDSNGKNPTCIHCLSEQTGWEFGEAYIKLKSSKPMPKDFDVESIVGASVGGHCIETPNGELIPFDWVYYRLSFSLNAENHLIMTCSQRDFDTECFGEVELASGSKSINDVISPKLFRNSKLNEVYHELYLDKESMGNEKSQVMLVDSFNIDFYHPEKDYTVEFEFSKEQIDAYNQICCATL